MMHLRSMLNMDLCVKKMYDENYCRLCDGYNGCEDYVYSVPTEDPKCLYKLQLLRADEETIKGKLEEAIEIELE